MPHDVRCFRPPVCSIPSQRENPSIPPGAEHLQHPQTDPDPCIRLAFALASRASRVSRGRRRRWVKCWAPTLRSGAVRSSASQAGWEVGATAVPSQGEVGRWVSGRFFFCFPWRCGVGGGEVSPKTGAKKTLRHFMYIVYVTQYETEWNGSWAIWVVSKDGADLRGGAAHAFEECCRKRYRRCITYYATFQSHITHLTGTCLILRVGAGNCRGFTRW